MLPNLNSGLSFLERFPGEREATTARQTSRRIVFIETIFYLSSSLAAFSSLSSLAAFSSLFSLAAFSSLSLTVFQSN